MYDAVASGGMATVHLGCLTGAVGFSRIVAIKVLRPQYAEDADFISMFIDEARVASRIHHPNVVPTLDVIAKDGELFTVMEYVHGETLSRLLRAGGGAPAPIASAIIRDVLLGLHAAHEATDERGESLNVVHRDVSPQNVIVGVDGISRVLDFGVAKAAGRTQTTREGQVKGKLSYMAPEQLQGNVTARADVFATAVILWEALTGERLFGGTETEIVFKVLQGQIVPPSELRQGLPPGIDAVVLKGLTRDPEGRFGTAREMAEALTSVCPPATSPEVGMWVERLAAKVLDGRQSLLREIESSANIPIKTDSTRPPAQDGRSKSPRRLVVGLAVAVVALAAAVVGAVLWRAPRAEHPSVTAKAVTPEATASAVALTSLLPCPSRRALPLRRRASSDRARSCAQRRRRPSAQRRRRPRPITSDGHHNGRIAVSMFTRFIAVADSPRASRTVTSDVQRLAEELLEVHAVCVELVAEAEDLAVPALVGIEREDDRKRRRLRAGTTGLCCRHRVVVDPDCLRFFMRTNGDPDVVTALRTLLRLERLPFSEWEVRVLSA